MADKQKELEANESGPQAPTYPQAPAYPQQQPPPPGAYGQAPPPPGAYGQAPPPYYGQPTTYVFTNAPGQQAGYVQQVPQVIHTGPVPQDYLVFALITTICCFWPTGICAIMKSVETRDMIARGNMAAAEECSRKARMYSIISLSIGLLLVLGVIVYLIVLFAVLIPSWG